MNLIYNIVGQSEVHEIWLEIYNYFFYISIFCMPFITTFERRAA